MELRSRLLSLVLSSICLTPALIKAAEYMMLPITSPSVFEYLQKAKLNILNFQEQLYSVPVDQKNYENTLLPWTRLGNDLLLNFGILSYVSKGDFQGTHDANRGIPVLQEFLMQSMILNSNLQSDILAYAENALSDHYLLSAYENYQILCILKSFEEIKSTLSLNDQVKLEALQSKSSSLKHTPFFYLKGLAEEKCVSQETILQKGFTVFNLNTCFLPDELAFTHGGMAPWKERISALTDKILEVDADVICLQEVHTEDSCFSLYDKLKERYIHFYVAIGPRPLGFSLKTLGLPNGLFVASKYPVQHPSFTPFSVTGYQMNYGIFDFVIANDSTPLGHIYTTHMQSLNENGFDEIREKEFLQLIEKIQSEFQSDFDLNLPHLVCGSLNIAWGSEEPGETLIHHYFYDAYNHGRSAVIAEESTCTNYFSEFCLTFADYPEAIDENARILDYALLYQPLPGYSVRPLCKRCSLKTVLVPMHSIDKPESAISNHHGLLSTIKRAKDRQHSNPNLPPVLH